MRQLITGTFLALAMMTAPALAQAPSTSGAEQSPAPTAPNSGAGIPGQPGNKNGTCSKVTREHWSGIERSAGVRSS